MTNGFSTVISTKIKYLRKEEKVDIEYGDKSLNVKYAVERSVTESILSRIYFLFGENV